jgi:hypothetical protein
LALVLEVKKHFSFYRTVFQPMVFEYPFKEFAPSEEELAVIRKGEVKAGYNFNLMKTLTKLCFALI